MISKKRCPAAGGFEDGIWYAEYSFSETIEIPPGGGLSVKRFKIAENNSPIPRDRYYFDYRFFRDVQGAFGDVSRFIFGFEKTFLDGLMSFDVRVPFMKTLESEQIAGEIAGRGSEFGNLAAVWKSVLYTEPGFLMSGGLGVSIPTANDGRLFLLDGTQILVTENESVHFAPVSSRPLDADLFVLPTVVSPSRCRHERQSRPRQHRWWAIARDRQVAGCNALDFGCKRWALALPVMLPT